MSLVEAGGRPYGGAPGPLALMPPSESGYAPHHGEPSVGEVDLDWGIVEAVATRLAGAPPVGFTEGVSTLIADFEGATSFAELLVSELTGLYPKAGPARVLVISRAGWVKANIAIFRHYLSPVAARLTPPSPALSRSASTLPAYASIIDDVVRTGLSAVRGAARSVVSAQIGIVLGFLSKRVLGQYDLVLPEDGKDSVYYVGPNIVNAERQFGFGRKEFRMWIALHETAHRAQFTGVEWLKGYFNDLVENLMAGSYIDPKAFASALRRMAEAIIQGRDPLGDTGLAGMFASDEQLERMRRLQALMCVLEGHGNFVMDTIGERVIPDARRMSQILRERRASSGLQRILFRLLGIDTKLKQYELGERFVKAVVERAGLRTFCAIWNDPANLPTLEEIEDPPRWLARVTA